MNVSQIDTALLAKLKAVAEAITHVEKRGRNDFHNYDFAQALDVTSTVRTVLYAQGLVVIPGTVPGSVQHFTETDGKGFVTTVDLEYTIADSETGAAFTVNWTGAGGDTGGDKGLYKAFTGALKYFLMELFLLPATNDPEHDGISTRPPVESKGKDAERPAAPRIPVDRCYLIANAACAAGLAAGEPGETPVFGVVFRAKLAQLGVRKVSELNVDQAETLEAFIAAEAKTA